MMVLNRSLQLYEDRVVGTPSLVLLAYACVVGRWEGGEVCWLLRLRLLLKIAVAQRCSCCQALGRVVGQELIEQ